MMPEVLRSSVVEDPVEAGGGYEARECDQEVDYEPNTAHYVSGEGSPAT
jgi:hypothetical protein